MVAAVVPPAPLRAVNCVSDNTSSTSINSWLNVALSAVGSTSRISPGLRLVAVPRFAPSVVEVGPGESTLRRVSGDAAAPFTWSRVMTLPSHHPENSGSLTLLFPALEVKAKIGAVPFGLNRRMPSLKFLGRSSVPQFPVPLKPAIPDIWNPHYLALRLIEHRLPSLLSWSGGRAFCPTTRRWDQSRRLRCTAGCDRML